MQRMTRKDLNIRWEVFLECLQLWSLARRLSTHNGPNLGSFFRLSAIVPSCEASRLEQGKHTRPILCHDPFDHAGFYTVYNVIANS